MTLFFKNCHNNSLFAIILIFGLLVRKKRHVKFCIFLVLLYLCILSKFKRHGSTE